MWIIIKYDKNKFASLKEDLNKRLGNNYEIYLPKILIQKIRNNKKYNKDLNLLGDYLFCFHNNFVNTNVLNILKYTRGTKYLLNGFKENQKDIQLFIKKCKESENKEGYLSHDFYDLKINSIYKLMSGPFANCVIKLVNLQKNKINIMIGKIQTTLKRKYCLFQPV